MNIPQLHNEDVPVETILRYTLKENVELKKKVLRLQDNISFLEKQIESFKKWQGRMASYKCKYWLNEGLALADQLPPLDEVQEMRKLYGNCQKFMMYYTQLMKVAKNVDVYMGKIKKDNDENRD